LFTGESHGAALNTGNPIRQLEAQLVKMANAQFDSDAFKRLLGLRFNEARARMYIIQRTHWTVNRRDCWAAVQSTAPLPVKKLIWDHERDELEGDKELGKPDHYTMSVLEGASVGLKAKDFVDIGERRRLYLLLGLASSGAHQSLAVGHRLMLRARTQQFG
jgi:hypothetical protein